MRWRSCATTTWGAVSCSPRKLIRDFDVRVKLNLITELVRGQNGWW